MKTPVMFKIASMVGALVTAVLCGEWITRYFIPAWPAIGLHGVKPEAGFKAWGRSVSAIDKIRFNSWGQLDLERTVAPAPGVYRIAFVGDSFLEESTSYPISLLTEKIVNREAVEIINLGVSATQTDEYYYRIKNIGLRLKVNHCYLFFYAGNDFLPAQTLNRKFGIAAVYPRDSILSASGFIGLNHILTNRERPVLTAWGRAGELNENERTKFNTIVQSRDTEMPAILADICDLNQEDRTVFINSLQNKNLADFYQILRNPDQGLFRSYYLEHGIRYAVAPDTTPLAIPVHFAYDWILKTSQLCGEKGLRFTLVVIPEAFQVDKRMIEQWQPIADMKQLFSPTREASVELINRARRDNIETIDLYAILADKMGTYLNLDGHWSAYGIDLVARELAGHIKKIKTTDKYK